MSSEFSTDLTQLSVAASPKLFLGGNTQFSFPDTNNTGSTTSKSITSTTKPEIENPRDNLEVAAQKFNAVSEQLGISLQFKRDQDTGATVISLVDVSSGKAIKQIPSEALLKLSASLGELQGNFINTHV